MRRSRTPCSTIPFFRRFFNVPELPAEQEIRAAGSGVIIDAENGLVVTSNHVVELADEIAVTLTDGRRLQAERVGADEETDVAVIKVPAENLSSIALGDSDKLEVGDFVVAIGNPFGIGQTVTLGIVSALRRTGLGIKGYEDFIQTDAPINPGNSAARSSPCGASSSASIRQSSVRPGGNVGIGFAIPINMARESRGPAREARRGKARAARHHHAGPDAGPRAGHGPSERAGGGADRKVATGSAAERAGLKAGDIITAIDKTPIRGAVRTAQQDRTSPRRRRDSS